MSNWQPIEVAPKNGTEIIIDISHDEIGRDVMVVSWLEKDEDGEAGWWDKFGCNYEPKYWIPLLELPKKKHWCKSGDFVCEDWYISHKDRALAGFDLEKFGVKVIYCPFCGEKE